MSNREKTGVQLQARKLKVDGNQPSKINWMSQVKDEGSKVQYKSSLDWKQMGIPAGVSELLVECSSKVAEDEGKWLNLSQFGDE